MADIVYMSKTAWQALLASIRTKAGYVGTLTASQAKTAVDNISGESVEISNATYLFYSNARIGDFYGALDSRNELLRCVKNPEFMSNFAANATSLQRVDLSDIDFSNCKDFSSAFGGCNTLTSIDFGDVVFFTRYGVSYNAMFASCQRLTSVDIFKKPCKPSDLSSCFSGCKALTSVDLSGVDTSELAYCNNMFAQCTALTSVTFPQRFDIRNNGAQMFFYNCPALQSLDLSGWVIGSNTRIGYMCYNNSALTSVTFGPEVESLGYGVTNANNAPFSGCRNLTTLRMKATTPPTMPGTFVLYTSSSGSTLQHIYVPAASVDAYKGASNWSYYEDIIEADPEE